MKKMTCREMGGDCDMEIYAETSAEMAKKMTTHVMEMHPDVAQKMSTMTEDEHEEWEKDFHQKWDVAPEVSEEVE